MKKLLTWVLALLLVAALTVGALAEGLEIEYAESVDMAIMAAETPDENEEADITSEDVELPVPEAEEALPIEDGIEALDGYNETAVSAASDVAIDAINFPDAYFREYVVQRFDSDGDGMLSEEECDEVDDIDIWDKEVTSLKGIEWFRNLVILDCSHNVLTSLDVSKNTALKELYCSTNQLTNLDLSKNTELTTLHCDSNQLTSLNVSKNTALELLHCSENQLTSLNVSMNTTLRWLYCSSNQLTSLDLSKNTGLWWLYCSSNQLTSLDLSKNTELCWLYCSSNQLTSLDLSKNTALWQLSCFSNQIASIDISNCSRLIAASSEKPGTIDDGSIRFDLLMDSDCVYVIEIDPVTSIIVNGQIAYKGEQRTARSLTKGILSVKDQLFTGKALKPAVTIKLDSVTLKNGTDYTVSYKNNKKIGTAMVIVTGKGNYTGTATATFKINPKKVSGLKLQAGKKQLTASWKKSSGVTGYQIEYGLKKNFSGAKKVTVKGAKTVKKVLKSLKSGKVYYVRVRAYKKVGKAPYYSDWSKAVKKKVK